MIQRITDEMGWRFDPLNGTITATNATITSLNENIVAIADGFTAMTDFLKSQNSQNVVSLVHESNTNR